MSSGAENVHYLKYPPDLTRLENGLNIFQKRPKIWKYGIHIENSKTIDVFSISDSSELNFPYY